LPLKRYPNPETQGDHVAASKVFHVGILVKDIEAAIEDFHELLGYTFETPIARRTFGAELLGETTDFDIRFVYSNEGPPYLELIEAHEDGVWGIQQGEGLHHIGAWPDDIDEQTQEFVDAGHRCDFLARMGDGGVAAVYFDREHPRVHGTRIEFLQPGPVIRGFDD
jgi:catechol 2,3-dioxygenase-like lactoylglutathione lyase family enzyme